MKLALIVVVLIAAVLAIICVGDKKMSGQENYRVTKLTVDPPTHNDHNTLGAALDANVPSIFPPLHTYRLEWSAALPSTDEYVVIYGVEAYGNPTEATQAIRWFTESPEGENRLEHYSWDDVVGYIQGIDEEHHS